ncbi:MAG: GNAT family N-acetyltransferase [Eubacteriales bacterium]|nr:GNAT family N-acetyltransferase [Eubacteriales bacterium]
MNRFVFTSNDILSLVEYNPCDDRALYEDWLDPETQNGYNGVHVTTYEEFQTREIKQRFFAMIQLNSTREIIGAVGISPPETSADLAIWVFKLYRRQGYGSSAFALATKYAIEELKIDELHAGAYPDNVCSIKMLKRCGYTPYPAGNIQEKHYITGKDIIQMDYIYSPRTIRLATPSDAPDMAEVHMRSWEVAYKDILPADFIREKNATRPELYKRVITEENENSYVIQYSGKTVGILKVAPPQDENLRDCYELHYIYLHPDYFRLGIGSQAMDFAFDIARSFGKSGMVLWVLEKNIDSIKFYEKCGFVPDGGAWERNFDKPLRSIRMRKDL